MATPTNHPKGKHPIDDLGPRLREAVERILGDRAPEGLMEQTIDRLRQRRPSARRVSRRRLVGVVALAAAASIAGLLLVWQLLGRGNGREQWAREPEPPRPIEAPREPDRTPKEPAQPLEPLPTLWAYHQAARQAPEKLERLLDYHADQLAVADPASLRIRAFGDFARETR